MAFFFQPCPNGLSDNDAKLHILNEKKNTETCCSSPHKIIINDPTISVFQLHLNYESSNNVFNGDDIDTIFNNFLINYLGIFYHSFPLKKCQINYNIKPLITPGIKISSQRKNILLTF